MITFTVTVKNKKFKITETILETFRKLLRSSLEKLSLQKFLKSFQYFVFILNFLSLSLTSTNTCSPNKLSKEFWSSSNSWSFPKFFTYEKNKQVLLVAFRLLFTLNISVAPPIKLHQDFYIFETNYIKIFEVFTFPHHTITQLFFKVFEFMIVLWT